MDSTRLARGQGEAARRRLGSRSGRESGGAEPPWGVRRGCRGRLDRKGGRTSRALHHATRAQQGWMLLLAEPARGRADPPENSASTYRAKTAVPVKFFLAAFGQFTTGLPMFAL